METVVVAVLSLIGTLAGAYFANRKASALLEYRLQQLETKVDRHNNLIERTYKLEEENAVMKNRMDVADHRIADLEANHV